MADPPSGVIDMPWRLGDDSGYWMIGDSSGYWGLGIDLAPLVEVIGIPYFENGFTCYATADDCPISFAEAPL